MIIPTRDNSAVLFLDLQEEIVKNSRTLSRERLDRAAGGLARLAALHRLPAFLSAVAPGGTFLTSVTDALPAAAPRMRTETSAFADQDLAAAIAATGRRILIISGVVSEIVVQRTALDAAASGYVPLVAVDACGGIDTRTEDAAWRRITSAGGATTSAITFAAELAGDFTTETGGATLAIMYELLAG
ncbi:MAG TPA: isochorismatase family protein [Bradyrhizobium sp.]|nr:isochorismatase family protein [Bradyrhizobium sp.]